MSAIPRSFPSRQLAPAFVTALLPCWAAAQTLPVPPVHQAWAGAWRAVEFNLPPASRNFTTSRSVADNRIRTIVDGAECVATYDGVVQAASIVSRIEERANWQLKAGNWPPGTDPAQLVGLQKEFELALGLARKLPPDAYRRVRFTCPVPNAGEDRYYVLNDARRLFEFRFPANGLGVGVAVFERAR